MQSQKVIGIDIADTTIRVVIMSRSSDVDESPVEHSIAVPSGIIEWGIVKQKDALIDLLRTTFEEWGYTKQINATVVVGLPESQIYTQIVTLPKHNKRTRDKRLRDVLAEQTPLAEEALVFSYVLLPAAKEAAGEDMQFLVSSIDAETASLWREVFDSLAITEYVFDVQSLAVLRSLVTDQVVKPFLLVDVGASATTVTFFDTGLPIMNYTLATGVHHMAQALVISTGLSAEVILQKIYTLDISAKNNADTKVIMPFIQRIGDDLSASLAFVQKKYTVQIENIVLMGGGGRMFGLTEYIAKKTGIITEQLTNNLLSNDIQQLGIHPEYVIAYGLALRKVTTVWDEKHPMFLPENISLIAPIAVEDIDERETIPEGDDTTRDTTAVPVVGKYAAVRDATESDEVIDQQQQAKKKLYIQIGALLGILVLGVGAIFLTLEKRNNARLARIDSVKNQLVSFTDIQVLPVKVLVATQSGEYTNDRVRGRIITDTVVVHDTYPAVVSESRRTAKKALSEGEYVWDMPLEEATLDKNNLIFPLVLSWLVYAKDDLNALTIRAVDATNKNGAPYAYNFFTIQNVSPTDNEHVYELTVGASLSINEPIEYKTATSEAPGVIDPVVPVENVDTKKYIRITETPTGFLNVRSGPGTQFDKIKQLLPNTRYILLEKSGDWIQLSLSDQGDIGWVLAEYTQEVSSE